MRKGPLILLLLVIAGGIYRRKFHYNANDKNNTPSTIEQIISTTSTGDTATGQLSIDVSSSADGATQYEGGGEYAEFSDDAARNAMQQGKRVILVFEGKSDPTSLALHDDIVTRQPRIPKNTIIFFVDMQNNIELANRLQVQYENTIIYIGEKGQEIRRSGNGVITLSQVVNGIDDLERK